MTKGLRGFRPKPIIGEPIPDKYKANHRQTEDVSKPEPVRYGFPINRQKSSLQERIDNQ